MSADDAAKPDTTGAGGDDETPGKLKRELNAFDLTVGEEKCTVCVPASERC